MYRTTLIAILALAALPSLTVTASAASGATGPGTIVAPKPPPPPPLPPSPPPTTVHLVDALTRIYRGDDGGALYLRQLGTNVYGFGEHPGLGYAYVLNGAISGDRIIGSWWDVPKGTRAKSGRLDLRWSQFGTKVVYSGGNSLGPKTFTAIPPNGIDWPVMRAAGFQSKATSDLDGAFVGDDGSRHYVQELSGTTAWVAERAAQPGERPGWVSVFVGQRKPGNGFSGTYVDVPKGLERQSGNFGAALIGTKRELMLRQTGPGRTTRLTADYALDWDRFASEIAGKLNGNVVGYAYAMTRNGGIIRSGAAGSRRIAIDGGRLPFTTHTQAQTASAAKTINATAIIMALHRRGLDVDTKVKPFLPSCLKTGDGVSTLTFRQILTHTSGLPRVGCNGGDPYDCLVRMLAAGRTEPRTYKYNTHAYDLLRLLVPLVDDTKGVKALFDLFECDNKAQVLNRRVSEKFARYMFDKVLDPAGASASFYPSGDFSLNYRCERRLTNCEPQIRGEAPRQDYFMRAGSGKLTMSALDFVRFLSALDRGLILPKSLVETMKTDRLGFDSSFGGRAGPYAWKNGGCPDFENKGRGCKTVAMVFPGDIQAYVTVNSDNNGYAGSLQSLVGNAFDAALR